MGQTSILKFYKAGSPTGLERSRIIMSPKSVDQASEGIKYLEKGLGLVREGNVDSAVERFYCAAVAFDKTMG